MDPQSSWTHTSWVDEQAVQNAKFDVTIHEGAVVFISSSENPASVVITDGKMIVNPKHSNSTFCEPPPSYEP